jgi:hypothetical protein
MNREVFDTTGVAQEHGRAMTPQLAQIAPKQVQHLTERKSAANDVFVEQCAPAADDPVAIEDRGGVGVHVTPLG